MEVNESSRARRRGREELATICTCEFKSNCGLIVIPDGVEAAVDEPPSSPSYNISAGAGVEDPVGIRRGS